MATGQNQLFVNPMLTPPTVGYGFPPPREILDWSEFTELYNYWIIYGFKGFRSQYEEYVTSPDDGVVISPKNRVLRYHKDADGVTVATTTVSLGKDDKGINGEVVPEGVNYQLWDYRPSNLLFLLMKYLEQFPPNVPIAHSASRRHTDGVVYFLSKMVVLSSSNVFGGSTYLQNNVVRTRADSFARSTGHYECTANNLENFMEPECLFKIKESMVSYPKLKVAMFKTVLHSFNEPARSRLLLETHQLTIFNIILIFVSRSSKSAAHSNPRVLEEYNKWFQKFNILKGLYGEDWVYSELILYDNSEIATENWPTLATCGLFLAMFLANIETWPRLRNSKINQYFRACELMESNSKEYTIPHTAIESDIIISERLLRILETNRLEVNVGKLFNEVDQALLKSYGPVATASGV